MPKWYWKKKKIDSETQYIKKIQVYTCILHRINKQENFEQYHQDENCSSEDSTSTYSENLTHIDSITIFWLNCHQKWKWLWKKKIEHYWILLFKIFLQNETQNNTSKNDLSFKSSCQEIYSLKNKKMTQENQRKTHKRVKKYHYKTVEICEETDIVFTRCRCCKQLFPSTLEFFIKESHKWEKRTIQPLCRRCNREIWKWYRELYKSRKSEHAEINPAEAKQTELFDENESVESKLDRILSFLWLNKWTCKK